MSCGAEEGSAGVSVEEVGLSSASLSLSAGLGLDGRVEVFGVSLFSISTLLASSGSEKERLAGFEGSFSRGFSADIISGLRCEIWWHEFTHHQHFPCHMALQRLHFQSDLRLVQCQLSHCHSHPSGFH